MAHTIKILRCIKMTRIILLRHGESEANLKGVGAGQTDVPLTELGVRQAELAARYILEHEKIDVIYSSDLQRAVNTALPVARALGLQINTDKRLREIDTGDFVGLTFEERNRRFAKEFERMRSDFSNFEYPNGEYVPEVYDRVAECICEITAAHSGKTVLIASHNGAMRAADAFIKGYSRMEVGRSVSFGNTDINIYEFDGKTARVIRNNIKEHLSEEQKDIPDTDKQ